MTISPSPKTDWQALVAAKRKQLDAQIPSEWRLSDDFRASVPANGHLIEVDIARRSGILTDKELGITENFSAVELLENLAEREFSSVEVTTAFCKRAAIAQQLVSGFCIHGEVPSIIQ
jgi:amidase